jgi:hypothetical protein
MHYKSLAYLMLLCLVNSSEASVSEITNKVAWQAVAGPSAAVTFAEFPAGTNINNQYASAGVLFTDNVFVSVTTAFPSDGHGVFSDDGFGHFGTMHLSFTTPRSAFAMDFIGDVIVQLYSQNQLIFTGQLYDADFTPFLGIFSTAPFDAAVITDPADNDINVDNFYIGPPVPAPSALALLGLATLSVRSRRRSPSFNAD